MSEKQELPSYWLWYHQLTMLPKLQTIIFCIIVQVEVFIQQITVKRWRRLEHDAPATTLVGVVAAAAAN